MLFDELVLSLVNNHRVSRFSRESMDKWLYSKVNTDVNLDWCWRLAWKVSNKHSCIVGIISNGVKFNL